jgi:hypothetical protein
LRRLLPLTVESVTHRKELVMNTRKVVSVLTSTVAFTTTALTVAAAPAAAAPKPSGATVFLCPDFGKPGYYRTTIRGVFPMAQADAVGYLVHIDDNPSQREFHVPTYSLNEDSSQFGWMPEEHDEIYAAAKFSTPTVGRELKSASRSRRSSPRTEYATGAALSHVCADRTRPAGDCRPPRLVE